MTIKLGSANILSALDSFAVGTRVTDPTTMIYMIEKAIEGFEFAAQKVPGQGFIPLTAPVEGWSELVSAGVGRKVNDEDAYVLRSWRGSVNAYLRREFAAPVESVAVVVYTTEAYLSDPEVAGDAKEVDRVRQAGWTHILVAVLASAGPRAPLSAGRFVSNLAGGNKEALVWTADEIRAKAKEIAEYANEWSVVAD